eukprot:scaffold58530_cov49-Attheya_sp.AAC.2
MNKMNSNMLLQRNASSRRTSQPSTESSSALSSSHRNKNGSSDTGGHSNNHSYYPSSPTLTSISSPSSNHHSYHGEYYEEDCESPGSAYSSRYGTSSPPPSSPPIHNITLQTNHNNNNNNNQFQTQRVFFQRPTTSILNHMNLNTNSNTSNHKQESRQRRFAVTTTKATVLFFLIVSLGFIICSMPVYYYYYRQAATQAQERVDQGIRRIQELEGQLEDYARQLGDVEQQLSQTHELEHQLASQRSDSNALNKTLEDLRTHTKYLERDFQREKDTIVEEAKKYTKEHERIISEQVQILQNSISRESERSVLNKFGPGPHRVDMNVKIPVTRYGEIAHYETETIQLEMAPLHLMPHSVHLFLEQVAHGLWNGVTFLYNGDHVLQAAPREAGWVPSDEDNVDTASPFEQAKLTRVSFPEYNAAYPHEAYTLGFAGRPGGPDFYINKRDNVEAHGPYGQLEFDTKEADPCFGRVVNGFDALHKLWELPTIHEHGEDMLSPHFRVKIESMNISVQSEAQRNVGHPISSQQEEPHA